MTNADPATLSYKDNQGASLLQKLADSTSAKRWDWSDIDESLWSASWPYQLAVLEAGDDGLYTEKDAFTLPINPESLAQAMPFATVLQATFGGVIENNGGVPLRPIILTGNLGVVNDRDAGEALGGLLFQAGGILGGTIQASQQLVNSAVATGLGPQFTENLYDEAVPTTSSGVPERSTGYYQWLYLQRFLESYAEAKKTADGNRLRLAFYVWKEQAAWLISPEVLQLQRTADKPAEYQYMFRATAFARLNPNVQIIGASGYPGGAPFMRVTSAGARNKLSSVLNRINSARKTLKRVGALAGAINADFENVGNIIRQVALMCKDAVGAAKTWADFPKTIQQTAYRIYTENRDIFSNLGAAFKSPTTTSSVPSTQQKSQSLTVDTSSIDDLPTDTLTITTPALRAAMAKEVARVRSLTTADFQAMRRQVEDFNSLYQAKVGRPDPRIANPPPAIRTATDDDFKVIGALSAVADSISQTVVIQRRVEPVSLLDYVAGLASSAGIDMRRAQSKFAVPFPYGSTLESLALQYLGDATRWGEIAALNELRQPYIDEVGQYQSLLANGSGNDIVIADASLLQTDHFVTISSQTQLPEQRRVVAIRELAPGYWSVTLGGPSDLARFKLAEQSTVHFYLPATVNSQKVIFIPSDQATTNTDLQLQYVPTLSDLERILQVGGVDGMLTDSGDIAITQDGDWPYVQGLAALIQWARTALNTPIRSWLLYPNFGINVQVGQSLADVSAVDILASVKNSFRLNDAFTGVRSAAIMTDGPVTTVTLELGVKGVDTTLPVSFQIAQ